MDSKRLLELLRLVQQLQSGLVYVERELNKVVLDQRIREVTDVGQFECAYNVSETSQDVISVR